MGKAKLSGKSGVYVIKNSLDSRIYVGSSLDMYSRLQTHKKKLKNLNHPNQKLNNFCKKYGYDKFIFDVLEFCDKEFLLEKEQFYMDKFESYYNGFNISKTSIYPYKDLTEVQIQERRENFAKKMGVCFYMYDLNFNETKYNSLKECERKTKISSSKLSECLNKKSFHKKYVFSKFQLNNEEIQKKIKESEKHFNEVKMKSIENISKTKSFKEPESVNIHKHEIMDYKICVNLNNKIKSSFVYNINTKKITQLGSIIFNKDKYLYAPTQSLLQKWLREKHNIVVLVEFNDGTYTQDNFTFFIYKNDIAVKHHGIPKNSELKSYNTYEKALEEGLLQALKLIK